MVRQLVLVLAVGCALWSGCTPKQYAAQADQAAYRAVAAGQRAALGGSQPFDVAYRPLTPPADGKATIRVGDKTIDLMGEGEVRKLTLDECLQIAFRNSRDLQDRLEVLYVGALDLANARRSWDIPLLEGDLAADATHVKVAKDGEAKSAAAAIGPTLTQRFVHGGVLTLAATLDWATDFIPGSRGNNVVGSLLEANLRQPLLRGAWRAFAYEDQYRLERDFLFAVFDYDRFRQTFAAAIFVRYYQVLSQLDRLENELANIKRLKQTFALTRTQAEAGQVSRIDQDEAEQRLLSAQVRLEENQQTYRDDLDAFKIQLGLPIRANVELDYPRALEELKRIGPIPLEFEEDEAVRTALAARPDVLTERARVRDAKRDVEIAADRFLPQLDVEMGITASGTDPREFHRVRFDRHTRFASVTFNYELDQTDNRDDYRLAMIACEKARRDLEEFLSEVRLEVRSSYRRLERTSRSYELQVRNVQVATRRRKLASLQQKEGQASARDVLEAEEGLRDAQNGLTSALVGYATTRVVFLTSLGLTDVDQRGLLHERSAPFKFKLIQRRYPYVANRPGQR